MNVGRPIESWERCMAAQGPAGGRCGGRAREEGQPEAPAAGRGAIGGLLQGPGGHTPLALRLTQLGALGGAMGIGPQHQHYIQGGGEGMDWCYILIGFVKYTNLLLKGASNSVFRIEPWPGDCWTQWVLPRSGCIQHLLRDSSTLYVSRCISGNITI